MRGAIPPLPEYVFMTRCLVNHKGNFTFTFWRGKKFDRKFEQHCWKNSSLWGRDTLICVETWVFQCDPEIKRAKPLMETTVSKTKFYEFQSLNSKHS
jgi:hypothetical protein